MATTETQSDGGEESGDYPQTIAGWQLTESSEASDLPGANYYNPHRKRVFVNIGLVSPLDPDQWRAKFNPHTESDAGEQICVADDRETVVQAAFEWMREHPAGNCDDVGQQAHLIGAVGDSESDSQ